MQYMELIPKEMQPVAGTDGAYYRRRQLMRQLPLYDQDPSQCRGLAEGELKLMEDFVKKYKAEALGVGEVALPGQGGGGKEEGKPQDKSTGAGKPPESTNGALESAPAGGHYVSAGLRGGGTGWQGCPGSALSLGSFQGTDSVSTRWGGKVAPARVVCSLFPILLLWASPSLLRCFFKLPEQCCDAQLHRGVLWYGTVKDLGGTPRVLLPALLSTSVHLTGVRRGGLSPLHHLPPSTAKAVLSHQGK